MKVVALRTLVFILISLLPSYSFSQAKLKNGFKDVELGKHINSFTDFSFQRKTVDGLSVYKRRNQDLSLGSIKLKSVEYLFYDNVLVEIKVNFDTLYYSDIVNLFSETYGPYSVIASWSDKKTSLWVRNSPTAVINGVTYYASFLISDIESSVNRSNAKFKNQAKDL